MMAPIAMTSCPTAETLASFVDDRLDADTRRAVIEHMAECAECRDAVLTADEFRSAETTDDAEVNGSPSRFGSRFGYTIAALAAAAAVALLFIQPIHERLFGPSGMNALVAASEDLTYRPSDGRLAGGFPYKPPKERMRSGESADVEASLQYAALKVLAEAVKDGDGTTRAAGEDARPAAAAYLFLGDHEELDAAVTTLEEELLRRTRASDIATALQLANDQPLLVDLSAAYLARGTWTGDEADFRRARAAAERAWALQRTPEAAWNRAAAAERLALDGLVPNEEAARAWEEYLALDPSSEWAEEARGRLNDLRRE